MGPILFAQAGPSGHEIWIVLGGVAVVASIVGNWAQWQMSRRKQEHRVIEPQPLDVRQVHDYVRKDECAAMHQANARHTVEVAAQVEETRRQIASDVEKASGSRKAIYTEISGVRSEMVDMERRLNRADEERTTGIHERLNEILSEVSEMRGQMRAKAS